MQHDSTYQMHIFRTREELSNYIESQDGRVGFVPTMGALHDGHLQLVAQAKAISDIVVVSVFVNPTQFNNPRDLERYPRDEEGDSKKLESAGCDVVWFPKVDELYPDEVESDFYDLGHLEDVMEGEFRPGHFQGVATIVDRLFQSVNPDVAIFGEKDYQQVAVIKRMTSLKNHPVEIVVSPTKRESSGLAMSSRNMLLEPVFKEAAVAIYKAMNAIRATKDERSVSDSVTMANEAISAAGLRPEYIVIADEDSLEPLEKWENSERPRVFVAAYAGEVRLIDNLSLN
ncbi:MAG: pantoate--beta-alanine ligase [Bacteroidetes bacterium]|nr:MAG: pantoate--beta-alanine ligase [Bacteroidota bacterium]